MQQAFFLHVDCELSFMLLFLITLFTSLVFVVELHQHYPQQGSSFCLFFVC